MGNRGHGTATVATLVLVLSVLGAGAAFSTTVLTSRGPRYDRQPASYEFVLEGGLAAPSGDQADDFWSTETGFDAGTGFQLGARVRQYVGPHVAVSPAFAWSRFSPADGLGDFGDGLVGYRLETSVYRYGLDVQFFPGEPGDQARLFLTGGIAYLHNSYRDEVAGDSWFRTSAGAPGISAGAGLRVGQVEMAAEYTWNRFSTGNLSGGADLDYNWDYAVVRIGVALGR